MNAQTPILGPAALTERAMVLNLSIGIWQGYRLDKEASRKVTDDAGAVSDAARVNKHLIAKEDLKPIVTAQGKVRDHFYSKTLPWRDNGDRLMTRKLFTDFIQEHERLVALFRAEVDEFLDVRYPVAIERAEFRMGEMFKRDDYPPVSALRHKFYIELDFEALTTSNDFRVQMDQDHVDRVRAQMETAAEKRIHGAMQDVWRRIAETIGYFGQRMAADGGSAVFRDSTVGNIAELIDLIPGLNVLDDPNIEAIRREMAAKFGNLDAKDIRANPAHRAQLATEADDIMAKMSGFMRAFGAE